MCPENFSAVEFILESWIVIGRTDAEAETPILWPPDAKTWLIGKDPEAGKDRRLEEKGMTEDEMVGWHHRLDGREFEQTPGVGDGQGSLACCSPRGCKESDTTEQLNWLSFSLFVRHTYHFSVWDHATMTSSRPWDCNFWNVLRSLRVHSKHLLKIRNNKWKAVSTITGTWEVINKLKLWN